MQHMSLHLQCLQSGRCYLGRAQLSQYPLSGISEKKYVSHIINILLTSFARSVRGKYGPLGLGSTDLTKAAWYVLPRSKDSYFPAQSRANEINKIYIRATLSSKRQVKHNYITWHWSHGKVVVYKFSESHSRSREQHHWWIHSSANSIIQCDKWTSVSFEHCVYM